MVWQLTLSVGVNRKFHVKTERKNNDEFLAKMFVIYTHLRRIFVSLYQKFCCRSHFFLVRLKNTILKQPFVNNFPTRFIYDLRVKKNNLCWWWKMHIERKIMLISEVRIMQILLATKKHTQSLSWTKRSVNKSHSSSRGANGMKQWTPVCIHSAIISLHVISSYSYFHSAVML